MPWYCRCASGVFRKTWFETSPASIPFASTTVVPSARVKKSSMMLVVLRKTYATSA